MVGKVEGNYRVPSRARDNTNAVILRDSEQGLKRDQRVVTRKYVGRRYRNGRAGSHARGRFVDDMRITRSTHDEDELNDEQVYEGLTDEDDLGNRCHLVFLSTRRSKEDGPYGGCMPADKSS